MKNICVLICLLVSVSFSACKKDANDSAYNSSYAAWLSFKNSVNNSYTYTNAYGTFTGIGTEVKTTVTNGVITARDYIVMQPSQQNPGTSVVLKQWHEDKTTLNTHGSEGGALQTLDQVYENAKNVWLKADRKTNTVIFENKNNGMISQCGFIPNNCADDCFTGITVTVIAGL